jgi:hypothetical protein
MSTDTAVDVELALELRIARNGDPSLRGQEIARRGTRRLTGVLGGVAAAVWCADLALLVGLHH